MIQTSDKFKEKKIERKCRFQVSTDNCRLIRKLWNEVSFSSSNHHASITIIRTGVRPDACSMQIPDPFCCWPVSKIHVRISLFKSCTNNCDPAVQIENDLLSGQQTALNTFSRFNPTFFGFGRPAGRPSTRPRADV
jgi:hypothetical protein